MLYGTHTTLPARAGQSHRSYEKANLARTMQADIEDGLPGCAVAALKSDGVAQGPTVPDKLREKCPQEDIYDFSDEVAGPGGSMRQIAPSHPPEGMLKAS